MRPPKKQLLHEFIAAANSDDLRIRHEAAGWVVRCGDAVLLRPSETTAFDTPLQAFRVLAGVGIRCALIEWDGLDALHE